MYIYYLICLIQLQSIRVSVDKLTTIYLLLLIIFNYYIKNIFIKEIVAFWSNIAIQFLSTDYFK
jgi:hypothetical protein